MTSVHKYLKGKEYLTDAIFTLGDIDIEPKLLDKLGYKYDLVKIKDKQGTYHEKPRIKDPSKRQEFFNIMAGTYVDLAKRINHTNAGFKITELSVHFDEGGMPHCHAEMVNLGHTNSGKPSFNLDNALGDFCSHFDLDVKTSRTKKKTKSGVKTTKHVNGHTAFRKFRALIDDNMVQCFNRQLKKRNKDLQVTLIRLGKHGGYSMTEYQARRQAEMKAKQTQKQLEQAKSKLKDVQDDLDVAVKGKKQAERAKVKAESAKKSADNQVKNLTKQVQRLQLAQKNLQANVKAEIKAKYDDEIKRLNQHDKEVERLKQFRQQVQERGFVNETDYINQQDKVLQERDMYKSAVDDLRDYNALLTSALKGPKVSIERPSVQAPKNAFSISKWAKGAVKQAERWFKHTFGFNAFNQADDDVKAIHDVQKQQKQETAKMMAANDKVSQFVNQTPNQFSNDLTVDEMQKMLKRLEAEGAGKGYKAPDYEKARLNSPAYKRQQAKKQVKQKPKSEVDQFGDFAGNLFDSELNKAFKRHDKENDGPDL